MHLQRHTRLRLRIDLTRCDGFRSSLWPEVSPERACKPASAKSAACRGLRGNGMLTRGMNSTWKIFFEAFVIKFGTFLRFASWEREPHPPHTLPLAWPIPSVPDKQMRLTRRQISGCTRSSMDSRSFPSKSSLPIAPLGLTARTPCWPSSSVYSCMFRSPPPPPHPPASSCFIHHSARS